MTSALSRQHHGVKPDRHPFGGCNVLRDQYCLIGRELSALDFGVHRYVLRREREEFRIAVASVPIEVLESYVEDLLDLDVPDEKLFICRRRLETSFQLLAIVGLFISFAWGLWSVSKGASTTASFLCTVAMATPFAVLWHFAPRVQLMRRLGYARIVSREVFRRRGGGQNDSSGVHASVLSKLLTSPTSRSAIPGAAKITIH
jgi:hypothetical protein